MALTFHATRRTGDSKELFGGAGDGDDRRSKVMTDEEMAAQIGSGCRA